MSKSSGMVFFEFFLFLSVFLLIAGFSFYKIKILTSEAQHSATLAIASSLTALNASNFILKKTSKTKHGTSVAKCSDIVNALPGGLPAGYSIEADPVSPNVSVPCTLNGPTSSAVFTVTGVT